jgi:hypothetical protein
LIQQDKVKIEESEVFHYPDQHEFRLRLSPICDDNPEDHHFAILQYEIVDRQSSTFDLYHTEGKIFIWYQSELRKPDPSTIAVYQRSDYITLLLLCKDVS